MSIKRIVPNITSDRMDETRKFYTAFLGLEMAMDMGWIVTLVSPSNPTALISLVRPSPSTSSGDDGASPSFSITIEVVDVDAVHAQAAAHGVQTVYPLTYEPWGVHRFHVTDPNGVVINVMTYIK